MNNSIIKKAVYVQPAILSIKLHPFELLAGSYKTPNPTLEEGWQLNGYVYEYGHDGDENYIVDYILNYVGGDDAKSNDGDDWGMY